jgi:hypothetical protein
MLKGILARIISSFFEEHSLLPIWQKGCYSGKEELKDQLLIPQTVFEDCGKRRTNLNRAYIDYQKHLILFHIAG